METVPLRCNHCGAPLGVAEKTRFITCTFCHSSLEVKRTESSVFTEEVAEIAANTEKMAESLEAIHLQSEIERLDREDADEQERQGRTSWAWIMLIIIVLNIIFGAVFLSPAAQKMGPAIPLLGAGLMLTGIVVLGRKAMRFASKNSNEAAYKQQRVALARRLETLRRS